MAVMITCAPTRLRGPWRWEVLGRIHLGFPSSQHIAGHREEFKQMLEVERVNRPPGSRRVWAARSRLPGEGRTEVSGKRKQSGGGKGRDGQISE